MNIKELRKSHKLIDLFIDLAEIPSPSLKEKQVADFILEILNINGIKAGLDSYGNIIVKIPASPDCKNVPPLLFSAHMDVVGSSDPVNIRLSSDGKYIETDKTRTLGADDKAGLAAILDLAIELNNIGSRIEHGPLEITFTRDEELGMSGIRNLDTSRLQSRYAVVVDGDKLGQLDVAGAGFTNVYINVTDGKGGHSGIDISDKTRVNAIKVLSEIDQRIPQGVYKQDETGVITSINAAVSIGGSAKLTVCELVKNIYQMAKENKPIPEKYYTNSILETINMESAKNIIATEARQAYSIRSSDPENERELLGFIRKQVNEFNSKYSGLINVTMQTGSHLKPFVRSKDQFLSDVIIKASQLNNMNTKATSFHAGAETHVLQNEKKNAKGEAFDPVIIGVANMENIHSADEKLDWESLLAGKKWLQDIVTTFANEYKK